MSRAALALLLLSACHAPVPSPAPARTAAPHTPAVRNEAVPFDALAEEARRHDLAIRVTRDGSLLFERHSSSADTEHISALYEIVHHVLVQHIRTRSFTSDESREAEWRQAREQACRALRLHAGCDGYSLSFQDAEGIARVFADGGVLDGERIFPDDFVVRATTGKTLAWESFGEGELAVITRPIFDSWRGVPSLDRSQLSAVEPLVDAPIPVDDFDRLFEEKLGRNADLFENELAKANRKVFERRWRTPRGFGAFGYADAVVVLTRTKLIAVYAARYPMQRGERYELKTLVPLLRALE